MRTFRTFMAMSPDGADVLATLGCKLDTAVSYPILRESTAERRFGFQRRRSFNAVKYGCITVDERLVLPIGELKLCLQPEESKLQFKIRFLVVPDDKCPRLDGLLNEKIIGRFHFFCGAPVCMTGLCLTTLSVLWPVSVSSRRVGNYTHTSHVSAS